MSISQEPDLHTRGLWQEVLNCEKTYENAYRWRERIQEWTRKECNKDQKLIQEKRKERHLHTIQTQIKQMKQPSQKRQDTCMVCDRTFPKKSTIRRRMKMHTSGNEDGKPIYMCVVCDKKVPTKFYMRKHIKMHMEWGQKVRPVRQVAFTRCRRNSNQQARPKIHHV